MHPYGALQPSKRVTIPDVPVSLNLVFHSMANRNGMALVGGLSYLFPTLV